MVWYLVGMIITCIALIIAVNNKIDDDYFGWFFTILELSLVFPIFWATVIIGNIIHIIKERKK